MLRMDNGCGVIGDVSYYLPKNSEAGALLSWRTAAFGTEGFAETTYSQKHVSLARSGAAGIEQVPALAGTPGGYLRSFAAEIRGEPGSLTLTTREVLEASRLALTVQNAADSG